MSDHRTEQFFDERADGYYHRNYERPRNRHAHNLALRRDACLALLPSGEGSVLDLGCGPGAMTIPLLEIGRRVVSTDLSHEMIAATVRLVRTIGARPCVAIADAIALPFADRTFSAVVTTGVLEYVPDIDRAMQEIARVLEPGGVAIMTMSLPRQLERAAMRMVSRLRGAAPQARQYILDRSAFDHVIEAAGLRIDACTCCGFAPFPLDALLPRCVPWIDKRLGSILNRSDTARDRAKTYIARARKP